MPIFIYYGPPGSGKSTLTRGFGNGFDLELVPEERRIEKLREILRSVRVDEDDFHIGAANTQVQTNRKIAEEIQAPVVHVLLLPEKAEYLRRRTGRDARLPHKAHQPDSYGSFERHCEEYDKIQR